MCSCPIIYNILMNISCPSPNVLMRNFNRVEIAFSLANCRYENEYLIWNLSPKWRKVPDKGPFINNVRIREGVTHVRTNANKGEGGVLTLRTANYNSKWYLILVKRPYMFSCFLQNCIVVSIWNWSKMITKATTKCWNETLNFSFQLPFNGKLGGVMDVNVFFLGGG